jgi:hypothetical protein
MRIKYVGLSDTRIIRKADWASVEPERGGPIDHDMVTWDASNEFTADVSDAAGNFLLVFDPEFKEVQKESKAK